MICLPCHQAVCVVARTGQFFVRVVAVNELGNRTAAQPIFILSKMCKPPDILMLGNKGRQVGANPLGSTLCGVSKGVVNVFVVRVRGMVWLV